MYQSVCLWQVPGFGGADAPESLCWLLHEAGTAGPGEVTRSLSPLHLSSSCLDYFSCLGCCGCCSHQTLFKVCKGEKKKKASALKLVKTTSKFILTPLPESAVLSDRCTCSSLSSWQACVRQAQSLCRGWQGEQGKEKEKGWNCPGAAHLRVALWQWLGRSLAGSFSAPPAWRAVATFTATPADIRLVQLLLVQVVR